MAALAKAAVVLASFLDVPVVGIVDGDGFKVYLEEVPPLFGEKLPVRIKGIDAPELSGKTDCEKRAAKKSKDTLTWLLKGEMVDLHFCERDKYWRIACQVRVNDIDVGSYMLANGYAVSYSGGTKIPFRCKE